MKTILDLIATILNGILGLLISFLSFLVFFAFAGTLYIGICCITRLVLHIATTLFPRI